jgi:hypothetical protein
MFAVALLTLVAGAVGGWSMAVAQDAAGVAKAIPEAVNPLVPIVGVSTPAGIGAYVAWWARGVREEATKKADTMIDLGTKVLAAIQSLSAEVRALGVKQDRSIVLQTAEVELQEELAERVDELETTVILALDEDPPTEEIERRKMLRIRKKDRERKRGAARAAADALSTTGAPATQPA